MSEPDPLTPEQREALVVALRRGTRIGRAGKIAAVNGWTLLVLGGLSVLIALFNPAGLLGGGALLAMGWNELRGRDLLGKLDPKGAQVLGWNQLALMGLIVAYCAWSGYRALANPAPELAELEETVGISREMMAQATLFFYGLVIALTALVQGLLARFYFHRRRMVEDQLAKTPAWVLKVLSRMSAS